MLLVNNSSLKLKLGYLLVVKLKTNKYYKELFYYLIFYIDLQFFLSWLLIFISIPSVM